MNSTSAKIFLRPIERGGEWSSKLKVLPGGRDVAVPSTIQAGKASDDKLKFDGILRNASQEDVFAICAKDVVDGVLSGSNGTLISYGPLATGKTHTLVGSSQDFQGRGLAARAVHHIFTELGANVNVEVEVKVSCVEIYNDCLYDLLATEEGRLVLMDERGEMDILGLSKRAARDEAEALAYIFQGERLRNTSQHPKNRRSSSGHCIFTVYLDTRAGRDAQGRERHISCKLQLVDLAGSERTKKTNVTGLIFKEATLINKSLSNFEQSVRAAIKGDAALLGLIRQSKLTTLLRDSLCGSNIVTCIAHFSVEEDDFLETVEALRFAARMRFLAVNPVLKFLGSSGPTVVDSSGAAGEEDKLNDSLTAPDDARPMQLSTGSLGINGAENEASAGNQDASNEFLPELDQGVAFTQYKQNTEEGRELAAAFAGAQGRYKEARAEARSLAREVNRAKASIDEWSSKLEERKAERLAGPPLVLPEGGIVIDEAEFSLVEGLKNAKRDYRALFGQLTETKAVLESASGDANEARTKLLTSFHSWYGHASASARKAAGTPSNSAKSPEMKAFEAARALAKATPPHRNFSGEKGSALQATRDAHLRMAF